jgi:hypothetical protein
MIVVDNGTFIGRVAPPLIGEPMEGEIFVSTRTNLRQPERQTPPKKWEWHGLMDNAEFAKFEQWVVNEFEPYTAHRDDFIRRMRELFCLLRNIRIHAFGLINESPAATSPDPESAENNWSLRGADVG